MKTQHWVLLGVAGAAIYLLYKNYGAIKTLDLPNPLSDLQSKQVGVSQLGALTDQQRRLFGAA